MNQTTIESVLEWLNNSSVNPRNKVNSLPWFHIPTILTARIQSQQQDNNQLFVHLLQRMMTILDECFDSHTPIPNKRLLHSSLSQLSQFHSLDPKIKRGAGQCILSLEVVDEGPMVVVQKEHLESMEAIQTSFSNLQQQFDQLQVQFSESERKNIQNEKEIAELMEKVKNHPIDSKDQTIAELKEQLADHTQLQREVALLRADKESFVSVIGSLQKEKEQLRNDVSNQSQKLEENECEIAELKQTIEEMKTELARKEPFFVSSDIIVAYDPNYFRVSGSTVTRINSTSHVGCFTRPVSKGIHRLSIKTAAEHACVLDAVEFPYYLTRHVYCSPQSAMMHNNGWLYSADKGFVQSTKPRAEQEWSAEADLEKRTLHFFLDGLQQPHHFIDIPVPLVFAIDTCSPDSPIEITFWGEVKKSHVTFQGIGHNLGRHD
ncbi:hypothetical protein BLNAU_21349 [Blattamonas nauphoetae]|uniref:Uncharacterized protein n=1 Tax=Blattamonas nauphoetae TaxID=2049346 RepID=A0ABQ9WW65_9EUKA|nr:hypothetical protein BLNAU_21349 [Blattamonas nauphoetae]